MVTRQLAVVRHRVFVPLAKLILGAELAIMLLGLLARSCDPLAGFDPPPVEKQSNTNTITELLIGLGVIVNSIAGFRILDGKQPMNTYVALQRVFIVSVLGVHVGLAVFFVRIGFAVGTPFAAAIFAVLAIAFSEFWSSTPISEEDTKPPTYRRRIAASAGAIIAAVPLISMATFASSSYAGMDVSGDIQSMDNGRVVMMVRHYNEKPRKVIIADPTKVIWSKSAVEHRSIAAGIPLPTSPSGKLTAYEDINNDETHVYVVVNSDGVEVGRITGIDGTSNAVFASDQVLLHSSQWPDVKTVVTDLKTKQDTTIKGWTAELPYDEHSALMTNNNEFGLINLNTGDAIKKEAGARVFAAISASGVVHFKPNATDACDTAYDLPRGTLQLGLPREAKLVPLSIQGQSVSSFITTPASSIALVGTTSSSGQCETYGRLYAVDIANGNVLSEVLDSYRDGRSIALSPDGKRVAYTEKTKLFVRPTAGGVATRINTNSSHVDSTPAWSTDGALWFASDMKPPTGNGKAWLWRMSNSGELTAINEVELINLARLSPYINQETLLFCRCKPHETSVRGWAGGPVPAFVLLVVPAEPASASGFPSSIAIGGDHACALDADGYAFCWGSNANDQLGDGTQTDRLTPQAVSGGLTFKSLVAGGSNTCGITISNLTYCWGAFVGDGANTMRLVPTAPSGGYTFKALTAGSYSICGIATSNDAYCWGFGMQGRLGNGSYSDSWSPVLVSGSLAWASLSAGASHVCGITTGNVSYCWGDDGAGQLGDGSSGTTQSTPTAVTGGPTFTSITAGAYNTCALTSAGAAYCWGTNSHSELGTTGTHLTPVAVSGGNVFQSISATSGVGCGLTTSNDVLCWGESGHGHLGNGAGADQPTPTVVSGGRKYSALGVGSESNGFCVIATTGLPYCWGWNNHGQLGDNTQTDHATPALVLWGTVTTNTTVSAIVDPSFTFAVANQATACNGESNFAGSAGAPTAIALGHLAASSNVSGGQALTVSSNAGNGFAVYIFGKQSTQNLRSTGYSWTDVSGSYASPAALGVGEKFGYTFKDSTASTSVTNPGSATFAKLDNVATNKVMGSSSSPSGSGCVSFDAQTGSATPAGSYTATVIYTAVPVF